MNNLLKSKVNPSIVPNQLSLTQGQLLHASYAAHLQSLSKQEAANPSDAKDDEKMAKNGAENDNESVNSTDVCIVESYAAIDATTVL